MWNTFSKKIFFAYTNRTVVGFHFLMIVFAIISLWNFGMSSLGVEVGWGRKIACFNCSMLKQSYQFDRKMQCQLPNGYSDLPRNVPDKMPGCFSIFWWVSNVLGGFFFVCLFEFWGLHSLISLHHAAFLTTFFETFMDSIVSSRTSTCRLTLELKIKLLH